MWHTLAKQDRLALVLLAIVAVVLMLPYLLDTQVVMWPRSGLGTDLTTYNWPPFEYIRQSLQAHQQISLWWGTTMSGIPLIGNPGVRVFYPPLLLMILLPLPIPLAFALVNTFHLWLAGVGAYGLARLTLKTGVMAALVGGLAMLLTPRILSNLVGDMGYTAGLCWIPLSLLCVRMALDRLSWRWAVAAGGSLAVLYVLNLFVLPYLGFFTGLYLLNLLVRARNGTMIAHSIGIMAIIGVVAAGLAAFQMLPFLTYLPYQMREAMTLEDASKGALPPPLLVHTFFPIAFKFPEWEIYVGLLPLVMIPLAFRHPARREAWIWLSVLVLCGLFALGTATPLFTILLQIVPGLRLLRVPPRIWLFGAVAAAMLASLGVDALLRTGTRVLTPGIWRWITGSTFTLIIISVLGRFLTRRPDELDWLLGAVAGAGLVIGWIGIRMWRRARINGTQMAGLLVVALMLDLFPLAIAFAEAKPVDEVFEMSAIGTALKEAGDDQSLYRIYSVRHELGDHIAVRHGWELAGGLNSFQFAPYSRYMREASGCRLEGVAAAVPPCASNEIDDTAYLDAQPNLALLSALNVRYIIAPFELPDTPGLELLVNAGQRYLYENRQVLPRVFGVVESSLSEDYSSIWSEFPANGLQSAQILAYRPNEIDVLVEMPEAGMLVVTDAWTPGWQALVDENAVPVERVHGALRGVPLNGGTHQIRLYFMPPMFVIGLIITIMTGVVLVVVFWIGHRTDVRRLAEVRDGYTMN